jgi:4-hydroxy-2-oxoheptanedioate aldolase
MVSLTRNPRWARVMGRLEFDYVIVDTEHSAFSRGEVADMVAMLERVGIVPIVRVPTPDPHYVTMAMDAGAQGVLAPYCETVEEVQGVVGGAKWRPLKGALIERALRSGRPEAPGAK